MTKVKSYLKLLALTSLFLLSVVMIVNINPIHASSMEECSTPTESVSIQAGLDSNHDTIAFNTSELQLSKNICARIYLKNVSSVNMHDFVIEATTDFADGLDMDAENNTVDYGFGPGVNAVTFMTPNKDLELEFFCEQPGHKDAGMVGTLFIGAKPGAAPGFEAPVLIFSFIFVGTVVTLKRRKQ